MRIKMTKDDSILKFLTLNQAAGYFVHFGFAVSKTSAKVNIKNALEGFEPRTDKNCNRQTAYGFSVEKIN